MRTKRTKSTKPTASPTIAPVTSIGPIFLVVVSIAVNSILVGQQSQCTAVAKDINGNTIPGTTASWSMNREGIASISETGMATGLAAGGVIIYATINGVRGQVGLVVNTMPYTA